jgi:hypothetical protein
MLIWVRADGVPVTPLNQPPPSPPTTGSVALTVGAGPDALVLRVVQDAWNGSAQYVVRVDGAQAGGTLTASALHDSGQADTLTVLGDWGQGNHLVELQFLNDAYGGTPSTDRNLYLASATYNGAKVSDATLTLLGTEAQSFRFTESALVIG